jgi:hypothetical protein
VATNITKEQLANLDVLEITGKDASYYGTPKALDSVGKLLDKSVEIFLRRAIAKINQKKRINTGDMQDIRVIRREFSNGKYRYDIGYEESNPASEYWAFQDKGVKGVASGQPSNSPYAFKNLKVGGEFLSNLIKWYASHRNYIKNEDQKKNLRGLQKKRAKLGNIAENKIKSIAYATGIKIKKEGLPTIGFAKAGYDAAFNEQFYKNLAKALGTDIKINIVETINIKQK